MNITGIENMLKGRMAETLFEELMRHSGNTVYRFGYEAIMQNLSQFGKEFDRHDKVGEQISSIPDFIVIDRKGKPVLVEVKFRWNGELHSDDFEKIERIQQFWDARIVLMNCWRQPYFHFIDPPFSRQKFVRKTLLEDKNWNVDRKLYEECERLMHRYFTPTLIRPLKDN